jgi:hypothetical protein
MSSAIRTPFGHRVLQVSHEAQIQIVRECRISSFWPKMASRITWSGKRSIAKEAGHPFVHFRHWKHSTAWNGPAASALSRKLKSGLKLDCCMTLNCLRWFFWGRKIVSMPHSHILSQEKHDEHVSWKSKKLEADV